MQKQSYLPQTDAGILALLVTFDMNLPGALATKYAVNENQLVRLRQGHLVFGWFMETLPLARQWAQSLTDERGKLYAVPGGQSPLPGGSVLPPVPTFISGGTSYVAQLEQGFFDFLARLVQQIKNSSSYDPADGKVLGIEGAEVPPPDPAIVPEVKWKYAPMGCPILIVKKTPFQGYTVFCVRGAGALVEVGFSTAREFDLDMPMPANGQAEVWRVQVQYRYKDAPFGQRSQIVEVPVHGV